MPLPLACDRDLLRRSLADQLSEVEEESLAAHLSQCASCQQDLEHLAGQREEWLKVSATLQREVEIERSAAEHSGIDGEHESYAADFAVHYLEPSTTAEALGRLGDIDVLEVIGIGGMGIVLKGFQPELKRLVAVKVLAPHLAVSGSARQRFAREAQAAAAILHPNVMPILTVHSAGKLPYLVMPFVACESLQQRIERSGPLELIDILRIGLQSADGLAAAHAQGLVHRDIKPANLLLEKGVDRLMITDFGLARAIDDASITRTGVIAGTPQYMSPEQARGEPVDARSDLFSLGSVLYTMAAGRPPFGAESTYGILRRITDSGPRSLREINSQIPEWFEQIVQRLLAKDPNERFSSAEEVAAVLKQCLAHVQQPCVELLPGELRTNIAGRRLNRKRLAAGFAALALVIVGGFVVNQWIRTNTERTLPNGAPENRVMDESQLQWETPEQEVEQLLDDASEFDERAERFWDE